MIGGSNVLTIFLEHKHCHSVWKATLIEHRFVQAAYWMDFPRAWLVLQLILAIDWIRTIVITLSNMCLHQMPFPTWSASRRPCLAPVLRLEGSWTPTVHWIQSRVIEPCTWNGNKKTFHGVEFTYDQLFRGGLSATHVAVWGFGARIAEGTGWEGSVLPAEVQGQLSCPAHLGFTAPHLAALCCALCWVDCAPSHLYFFRSVSKPSPFCCSCCPCRIGIAVLSTPRRSLSPSPQPLSHSLDFSTMSCWQLNMFGREVRICFLTHGQRGHVDPCPSLNCLTQS